jgi:hypothetical protein
LLEKNPLGMIVAFLLHQEEIGIGWVCANHHGKGGV